MNSSAAKESTVFAIVGAERLLRREALALLLQRVAPDPDPLGSGRYDGESVDLADVLDDVRTPSLLGDRRVVLVDDADDFITRFRLPLERYCADPSPVGVLILLCASLPKGTRLYKQIAATGEVISCEAPKPHQIGPWLIDRAARVYGKKMSGPAAASLREHLGSDLGRLDAELSKLAAYVGRRDRIEVGDVNDCTGRLREEKVFGVMDALAVSDTARALRQWDQVLATDRAAAPKAIGGLAFAVRNWMQCRREFERGAGAMGLATRLFVDVATLQRAFRTTTLDDWRRRLSDLLKADHDAKTGLGSIELAIEKYLVRHGSGGRSGSV